METTEAVSLRPVIVRTLVVCLAVMAAPWFSGGQQPVALLVSGGAALLAGLLLWQQPPVRRLAVGPLAVTYGCLMGWALLSLLWSANRYSTVIWILQWALAGLAFVVAYIVAGERRGRELMLGAYIWS